MYKNNSISMYLACGLVALLTACGQTEVMAPEEPKVEAQVLALNLTVNNTSDWPDANPGNGICASWIGNCTLRAAIEETNAWPTKDKINVPAGLYVLIGGYLNVTDSVVIKGAMEGVTTIDGNGESSVFYVDDGNYSNSYRLSAEFHHLTIRNGYGQGGGAIFNDGAKVLVNKSIVIGNRAYSAGGGLLNKSDGIMEVRYSTIRENGDLGGPRGGGIANLSGSMLIFKSSIHHNQANRYGGVLNQGLMNIVNTTVSHNLSSVEAGGVNNTPSAILNMNNVTIAFNEGTMVEESLPMGSVGSAGGLVNNGVLNMANSIVAHNLNHHGTAQDCVGNITSKGYNLIFDDTNCTIGGDLTGNLVGEDPLLGPLDLNGGITRSHALNATSPARNAGNPAAPTGVGTSCEPDDQRSKSRGVGPAGRCDMGAYEYQAAPDGVVSP